MMKIIKDLLIKIINDIDTGNSNLSADECNKVIEYLTEITNKNEKLSKYQACKYLKVSRATFDNYVRAGKIPKGRKQIGFKEFKSAREAARSFGKERSNSEIIKVCKGYISPSGRHYNTALGFKWKYKESSTTISEESSTK